ncbi:serine protease [Phycisphaerales bacterium]|nr:serine protease [Phycisphaerales bacterium]
MSLSPVLLRKVELALHEISNGDPSKADQLINGLKTIDHGQEISEREYERIRLISVIRRGRSAEAMVIWQRLQASFSMDPSALMNDIQVIQVTAPNEVRQFLEALQQASEQGDAEMGVGQVASPLAWVKNVPRGRVVFGTVIAAVAMIVLIFASIGRDDEVEPVKIVAATPPSGPSSSSGGSGSSPPGGSSPSSPSSVSSSSSGGNGLAPAGSGRPLSGQDFIELVGRSTVQIWLEISHVHEGETYWWRAGSGSGFVISDEHIMTNRHCIQMDETEMQEWYADAEFDWNGLPSIRVCVVRCGEQPREFVAEVVWQGSGEDDDVAMLKVRGHGVTPLSVESVPAPGSDIYVYGFPGIASSADSLLASQGEVDAAIEATRVWEEDNSFDLVNSQTDAGRTPTLTKGIVTKVVATGGYALMDANISVGNSGGPVFNELGQVVGIATLGIARADEDNPAHIASMNAMLKLSHVWKLIRGSSIGNRLNWSHLN